MSPNLQSPPSPIYLNLTISILPYVRICIFKTPFEFGISSIFYPTLSHFETQHKEMEGLEPTKCLISNTLYMYCRKSVVTVEESSSGDITVCDMTRGILTLYSQQRIADKPTHRGPAARQ